MVNFAQEMRRIKVRVEMFAMIPVRVDSHGWWYLSNEQCLSCALVNKE